jgi:hypothetical protein
MGGIEKHFWNIPALKQVYQMVLGKKKIQISISSPQIFFNPDFAVGIVARRRKS